MNIEHVSEFLFSELKIHVTNSVCSTYTRFFVTAMRPHYIIKLLSVTVFYILGVTIIQGATYKIYFLVSNE